MEVRPPRIETDETDDEAFEQLLSNSIRRVRRKRRVFSNLFWAAVVALIALLGISIPNAVRLTEYSYPFQNSIATYHFNIQDPSSPNERFYLNVKLTSVRPAIMTHAPMKFEAEMIPIGNRSDATIPQFYFLILTGSNCAGYGDLNRISDDTCMMRMYCNVGVCTQHIDSMRYLSSGEFPLLLATESLFNGTVTSTGSEHIFILPIESYFSNEHTRDGLVVAAIALVAFILFEGYKATKRQSATTS